MQPLRPAKQVASRLLDLTAFAAYVSYGSRMAGWLAGWLTGSQLAGEHASYSVACSVGHQLALFGEVPHEWTNV